MPVASAKAMGPKTLPSLGSERVNLLKQEKTFKGSLRMKRYKAALDNEYLLKILAASRASAPCRQLIQPDKDMNCKMCRLSIVN